MNDSSIERCLPRSRSTYRINPRQRRTNEERKCRRGAQLDFTYAQNCAHSTEGNEQASPPFLPAKAKEKEAARTRNNSQLAALVKTGTKRTHIRYSRRRWRKRNATHTYLRTYVYTHELCTFACNEGTRNSRRPCVGTVHHAYSCRQVGNTYAATEMLLTIHFSR